jgi:PAS domain-containing protein
VYFLDDLMPREDFAATPVYNEWWHPAGFGLGNMAANLHVSDEASALIFVANAPGNDQITGEQAHIFKAALRHFDRAVRVHHELRIRDLDQDTTPERLEHMGSAVMLVDRSAKVLFANPRARALLGKGSGITLHDGRLQSTTGSDNLQRLIASCAWKFRSPGGLGGEISLRLGKHRSLRVSVTPLRARGSVTELPWLGLQLPVAIVTVNNPGWEKWPN